MAAQRKRRSPAVTAETTAAVRAEQPGVPVRARRVLVNEGMRQELQTHGQVVDPATGLLLRKNNDGRVVVVDRATGDTYDLAG